MCDGIEASLSYIPILPQVVRSIEQTTLDRDVVIGAAFRLGYPAVEWSIAAFGQTDAQPMNQGRSVCEPNVGVAGAVTTPVEEPRRLSVLSKTGSEVVNHRIETGFGNILVLRKIVCTIEQPTSVCQGIIGVVTWAR
ncbi:hypothetical protein ASF25_14335 [Methylobacterium sp. Leaf100]|nr:hypothetical protein ASF25_14335 [Methylobacterium sp. Leaf100]